jgi:hypothetical protein
MSDEDDVRAVAEPVVRSGGFPFSDPRAWLPAVLLLALVAGLAYYARTLDQKNASL